jgi:hypothetical protein
MIQFSVNYLFIKILSLKAMAIQSQFTPHNTINWVNINKSNILD